LREGREDWLQVIRGHSKFFLILAGVFGAVSGAGIWLSIGLADPEAASARMIRLIAPLCRSWRGLSAQHGLQRKLVGGEQDFNGREIEIDDSLYLEIRPFDFHTLRALQYGERERAPRT